MSGEDKIHVYTGVILGYQRGSNTQYENKVLVAVDGMRTRGETSRLIGWRIIYKDSHGNVYRGKIVSTHGTNNVVIAVFKPNLPGQAIGGTAYIYPKGVSLKI
ncbi:MAG: 50S ribosomal protein L35ae [Pyrodictiaceae archaeon]